MKNSLNSNPSIRVSLYPSAIFTSAFDQAKADSKAGEALNPNDLPRVGYARAGYTAGLAAVKMDDHASAEKWFKAFAALRTSSEMLSLIASLSFDHDAADIALLTGVDFDVIHDLLNDAMLPEDTNGEDFLKSEYLEAFKVRCEAYSEAVELYRAMWTAAKAAEISDEEEEVTEEEEEVEA